MTHRPLSGGVIVLIAAFSIGCADEVPAPPSAAPPLALTPQISGTRERLQAISIVDRDLVWVSGTGGVVARTTDGGDSWYAQTIPGGEELELRDIHAHSDRLAYVLSAGTGEKSRILVTRDGGETWREQWRNREPEGFYDCFDFWSPRRGMVFGDSVSGRLQLVMTEDGETWTSPDEELLPRALDGEGGFAASGACLIVFDEQTGWIGTGAGGEARLVSTADAGRSWQSVTIPVFAGTPSSGITALSRFDGDHAIAVGGDVADPDHRGSRVAVSADGGRSWRVGGDLRLSSAAYGVAARTQSDGSRLAIVVGPGGMAISRSGGRTWQPVDDVPLWSVGIDWESGVGWAVGPEGAVVRFESEPAG